MGSDEKDISRFSLPDAQLDALELLAKGKMPNYELVYSSNKLAETMHRLARDICFLISDDARGEPNFKKFINGSFWSAELEKEREARAGEERTDDSSMEKVLDSEYGIAFSLSVSGRSLPPHFDEKSFIRDFNSFLVAINLGDYLGRDGKEENKNPLYQKLMQQIANFFTGKHSDMIKTGSQVRATQDADYLMRLNINPETRTIFDIIESHEPGQARECTALISEHLSPQIDFSAKFKGRSLIDFAVSKDFFEAAELLKEFEKSQGHDRGLSAG